MVSKAAGAILAVTGFLACPCHLAFTLHLLVAVFGGSALGAFLAANTGLVAMAATLYFVGGLGAGWYLLTREKSKPRGLPERETAACCTPLFQGRDSDQPPQAVPSRRDPALLKGFRSRSSNGP